MKRFRVLCASAAIALPLLAPNLSRSAEITGFRFSESGPLIKKEETFGFPILREGTFGEVFDFELETEQVSNVQRITTRGSADFTTMARNANGVLYAIQEHGQLVTIDEETGLATKVVDLFDPNAMGVPFMRIGDNSVRCPAMAFVPGDGDETLYAIINRQNYYDFLSSKDNVGTPPPDIDVEFGFILVTVDLETGWVTDTGILLDGQNFGRGHGLEYDNDLGVLVYFFYEEAAGDDPSPGASLQIIDPNGSTFDQLAIRSGNSGQSYPGAFTGVAGVGGGNFIIYDDYNGTGFHQVILFYDEMLLEFVFEIFPLFGEVPDLTEGGEFNIDYVSTRAMETTADGTNLLFEDNGYLFSVNEEGELVEGTEPLRVTVGGFPLLFTSMITDPLTGDVYGLGSLFDKRKRVVGVMEEEERSFSPYGIYAVDRDGGEDLEIAEPLAQLFTTGGTYIDNIFGICFGPNGDIWGIGYFYGGSGIFDSINGPAIFRVNSDGEVVPVIPFPEEFKLGSNPQIEYSPETDAFYLLDSFGAITLVETGLVFTEISRDGTFTDIPLSGEEYPDGMSPNGLVFVGDGTFLFSLSYYSSDLLFSVTTEGTVEFVAGDSGPVFDEEPDFLGTTTALTQAGPLGIPDISVGAVSPRRLIGNNRYSRVGRGQRAVLRKRASRLVGQYFIRIENDGAHPALFVIKGTSSSRKANYSYIVGGRNVTATVRTGTPVVFNSGDSSSGVVRFSARRGNLFRATNFLSGDYGSFRDKGLVSTTISRIVRRGTGSIKPKPTGDFFRRR